GPGALPDPDASNNSASATVTVADRDQADLRVQMVAAPAVVTPGTQVTYTIDIDNLGPAHIPSVRLVDVLPAGVTVVSISAPPVDHRPCTVNGNTISCGLGSFGAGPANPNSKRVTIVVTASASGTVTSTVTATAMRANTPPVGDPDPSNN